MANEMVLAGGKFNRPAHLTTAFADEATNLKVMSTRVPTLSIQGKVFAISADGKELRLTRTIDGDTVPLQSVPVVILGFNAQRGRSYYEGTFDPKNITPPRCWSHNGVAPDDAVPDKVSPKCGGCPMAAKGSRISDNNKQVAACSEYRLLALVPYKALHTDMPALRLRLPPTSDYDGQNTEAKSKDMYAFSQYVDFIRSRGVSHSYEMVTKMSFDQTPGITYPKLWFQPAQWIDDKDVERIREIRNDPSFATLLETSEGEVATQAAAAQGGAAADQQPVTRSARAGAGAATAKPDAAAKAAEKKATEKKAQEEAAAKAAAEQKARDDAATAAAAKAAEEQNGTMNLGDDDDGGTPQTAAMVGTVDPKAPPSATAVADDKDVDDLMAQWSGD